MTRFPRSASILQAVAVGVEELSLVDADHLGVRRDAREQLVEVRTFSEAMRMSLCDTM